MAVPVALPGPHLFCMTLFSPSCTRPPPLPSSQPQLTPPEARVALTRVGPVSTGILKDYLRELPTPLITQPLYQVVLEAMARGPPSRAPPSAEGTRGLLSCLPDVERVSWAWVGVGRTRRGLTLVERFTRAWASNGQELVASLSRSFWYPHFIKVQSEIQSS